MGKNSKLSPNAKTLFSGIVFVIGGLYYLSNDDRHSAYLLIILGGLAILISIISGIANKADKEKTLSAVQILTEKADAGDIEAQMELTNYYAEKDFEKAKHYCKLIAEAGNPNAQYVYAGKYCLFIQNPDYSAALEWFTKAADQGHAGALRYLGFMYSSGRGVKKDDIKAVEFYQMASEKEDGEACYDLAMHYLDGSGVEESKEKAIEYLQKAIRNGYEEAKVKLAELQGGRLDY